MSGVSSGGYMAVQMHVANASRIKGAAALAAGPYYCAQGSLWAALNNCLSPGPWSPLPATSFLAIETQSLERLKRIDPTADLASSRVWLFSGTRDRTVTPEVVRALRDYYAHYKADVLFVADKPAGHAMVTLDAGNACGASAPPYINDCDYDAAGELLKHLVGPLAAPASGAAAQAFDQRPFEAAGLHAEGFVYVPAACRKARCRVHVAFHGCRQPAAEFAQHAGYNRWAESNRLIVLYPQVKASYWPFNPRGCWDWWGYTGPGYHTRDGAQVRAVLGMVERLSASK